MSVYYNENDPRAAAWIRELIRAGEIPDGDVDERSITEVQPDDVRGYGQCHWFAGIGGWAYALQLAGWGDRAVWTGSCPCQPFSSAGKRAGTADARHLWPEWIRLVEACRPRVVFGEQVASAETLGTRQEAAFVDAVRAGQFARSNRLANRLVKSKALHYPRRWIDAVSADMAALDYSVRAEVLGAHSVGAPHIRQRLWFVADAASCRYWHRQQWSDEERQGDSGSNVDWKLPNGSEGLSASRNVADAERHGRRQGRQDASRVREGAGAQGVRGGPADVSGRELADDSGSGLEVIDIEPARDECEAAERGISAGLWDACDWLPCRDGKSRPVEPGTFPLAHGLPGRVGLLRGYGNAIVPQVAAAFVSAYMEVLRA